MSIPKVKIAVLKNLLIFGEKYLPQSVRLLEGGGVETLFGRIPFEHASSLCGASLIRVNFSIQIFSYIHLCSFLCHYIRIFVCGFFFTNVTLWWSDLLHFFSFIGIRWTKLNYWGDVPTKKVSVFMSVELSNFCWSECQHTRKVCIFLFQAITLQNFSSFLDLKTNWL